MTEKTQEPSLTFDMVREYLFEVRTDHKKMEPLNDYRLAAGMLFERHNDRSERALYMYRGDGPYIEVIWASDFSVIGCAKVPVTEEVVSRLLREGIVEGTPQWGFTDKNRLRLSKRGKQKVVREWYTKLDLMDLFCAGASYNTNTKEWSWT